MILYLDTSALVKLYVEEEGTEVVERAVAEARSVATSVLSSVEANSAFAQLARDGRLTAEAHRVVVASLANELSSYRLRTIEDWVLSLAGDLARRHTLGTLGALHLATAIFVPGGRPDDEEMTVEMLTFDKRLEAAARAEMSVYDV